LQVLVQPPFHDVRQACFYIPWAPLRLGLAHNLHQMLTDTQCLALPWCFVQVLVQPPFDDVRQACFHIPWAPLHH
jgi:hypothetical protein